MKRTLLWTVLFAICALSNAACGGGSGDTGTGGGGQGPSIFVTQENFAIGGPPLPSSIEQFPEAANGVVTPTSTVTGQADVAFNGLAVDATGKMYVSGQVFNANSQSLTLEILVFAAGASGHATPTRTITGASTDLNAPDLEVATGLAVDGSGNIRIITGSATTLANPGNLSLDSDRNIYVLDSGNILKFAAGAMGNAAPSATISSTSDFNAFVGNIALH